MQLTPFNGFLTSCSRLSRLSCPRSLRTRDVRQDSKSAAQWVCRRCHSQLTKSTTVSQPTIFTRGSIPRPRPTQTVAKNAFSSTSRRNDLPPDSSSKSPKPDPPPSSPLPSHAESLRSPLSHRFTHLMDTLQSHLTKSTRNINALTGYTPIESLKTTIHLLERRLQDTRHTLSTARTSYSQAINQRSASQREVNSLLQRKHAWTPADLERFTELYRSDHANELNETQAHEALVRAEKEAEEAGQQLSESILKRYHEEQIWSDKIRRMSTWGTWGLMGVNVLLFLVFQIGVEPWRRSRLVRGFEEKVKEAMQREISVNVNLDATKVGQVQEVGWNMQVKLPDGATTKVREGVDRRGGEAGSSGEELEGVVEEEVGREVVDTMEVERSIDTVVNEEIMAGKGRTVILKEKVKDLFSERQVVVRQWELTALVLEGAAAGMAVVGLMVVLLRPR